MMPAYFYIIETLVTSVFSVGEDVAESACVLLIFGIKRSCFIYF